MNCPKCPTSPLSSTTIRDIEVDRCPVCGGVWFDKQELQHLLDLSASELKPIRRGKMNEDRNRQKAVCPRDGSRLTRLCSPINPEIIVDSCPDCQGVWCDGGELEQLLK